MVEGSSNLPASVTRTKENLTNFSQIIKSQVFFHHIALCLNYKDILSLMTTCQLLNEMGNLHIKMLLKQLNFSEELEKNSEIQEYSHFLRFFYYRELLNAQLSIPLDPDLKVIRNNKLGFKGIKEFSIGLKFSGFLLYNKDLIVIKTEELYDISIDNPEKLTIKKVKMFSTNAKNFIYLTEKKEVFFLINEENTKLAHMKRIQLNLPFPILEIGVSFYNLLLIKSNEAEISENIEINWFTNYLKSCKSTYNIFILSFSDLVSDETYKEPHKLLRIIEADPFQKEIKSFCLGQYFAYFVNENFNLYQAELTNLNKSTVLPIEKHHQLFHRTIEKVFSSLFYYFAIEKEEVKSISTWDNARVLKWSEEIGFSDFTKILKYENIGGEQLANANKTFLNDTLGMAKTDLQNKFLTEISNNLKNRFEKQVLYGWGNNNLGQLGLLPCSNVSHPTKIPIPDLDPDDVIEKIECGWKFSCFLTKNHKLFICEANEKKQLIDKIEAKLEEEKEKALHPKKSKKDEKKPFHQAVVEKKEKARWINISSNFEKLKDKRTYIIANVSIGKEGISVLGGSTGVCKAAKVGAVEQEYHEEEIHEKKSKFRTAGYIIDRIHWDPNLNENEYKIGYEDRFLGIVEIEFEEYIAKSAEIKEHRIQYFKKSGETVWDKNKKIDKF